MTQFIDKRHSGRHKSAVNRRRFLQRFKKQISQSVANAVAKRSIIDFEHGEKINIPMKDTHEPTLHHGEGGVRTIILPGNREFSRGDTIKRPQNIDAINNNVSNSDEIGEDNFVFELTREEFLEIFFDDLELPNLLKKDLGISNSYKRIRAGFMSAGIPTNINIVKSMRNALARRIALTHKHKNKLLDAELELKNEEENSKKSQELNTQIIQHKKKISKVKFIDPFDIKYNRRILQPAPSTKAVVFCLMDISGSMDEVKKDLAKRFFILLYLFLTKNYETIDIVFIRHHTSAKEVNEQEFFFSKETGGTVVSSALEMMADIIHDRYPSNEWNIYGAQASDGDNWSNDSPHCREVLMHRIMPYVQYFAYIEILPRDHQSLWEEYLQVKNVYPNFAMQHITNMKEIYPVFRDLFKRQAQDTKELQ